MEHIDRHSKEFTVRMDVFGEGFEHNDTFGEVHSESEV